MVNNTTNVSFNGGTGGIKAQPSAQELAYAKEKRTPPSGEQLKHQQLASKNPELKRSRNGGKPLIAATRTAGDFSKSSIVPAKSARGPVKPASLKTGKQDGDSKTRPNKNASANIKPGTNSPPKGTGARPASRPVKKPPPKDTKKPVNG